MEWNRKLNQCLLSFFLFAFLFGFVLRLIGANFCPRPLPGLGGIFSIIFQKKETDKADVFSVSLCNFEQLIIT